MGRHGFSEDDGEGDYPNINPWYGMIASAKRGKRGQAFFRALVDALDAMPGVPWGLSARRAARWLGDQMRNCWKQCWKGSCDESHLSI